MTAKRISSNMSRHLRLAQRGSAGHYFEPLEPRILLSTAALISRPLPAFSDATGAGSVVDAANGPSGAGFDGLSTFGVVAPFSNDAFDPTSHSSHWFAWNAAERDKSINALPENAGFTPQVVLTPVSDDDSETHVSTIASPWRNSVQLDGSGGASDKWTEWTTKAQNQQWNTSGPGPAGTTAPLPPGIDGSGDNFQDPRISSPNNPSPRSISGNGPASAVNVADADNGSLAATSTASFKPAFEVRSFNLAATSPESFPASQPAVRGSFASQVAATAAADVNHANAAAGSSSLPTAQPRSLVSTSGINLTTHWHGATADGAVTLINASVDPEIDVVTHAFAAARIASASEDASPNIVQNLLLANAAALSDVANDLAVRLYDEDVAIWKETGLVLLVGVFATHHFGRPRPGSTRARRSLNRRSLCIGKTEPIAD